MFIDLNTTKNILTGKTFLEENYRISSKGMPGHYCSITYQWGIQLEQITALHLPIIAIGNDIPRDIRQDLQLEFF